MGKKRQPLTLEQRLRIANTARSIVKAAMDNAIKEHETTVEEVQALIGTPGQVFELFNSLFAKKQIDKNDAILSLLPTTENLILEALDGKRTIANAKIFKSYPGSNYAGSNFDNWRLNSRGKETKETPIQLYELVKDAYYSQMFNYLSNDLNILCLTQDQIIRFCEKYPHYLTQEGNATLFLFKENKEYLIAGVIAGSDGLSPIANRFGNAHIYYAANHHRLVVPQLFVI